MNVKSKKTAEKLPVFLVITDIVAAPGFRSIMSVLVFIYAVELN